MCGLFASFKGIRPRRVRGTHFKCCGRVRACVRACARARVCVCGLLRELDREVGVVYFVQAWAGSHIIFHPLH